MQREELTYKENKQTFNQGNRTNVQNIRAFIYRGGIRL